MASGLIIASNTVLTEVHLGLQKAIEETSKGTPSEKNHLGLAALAKEFRKYDRLMDQQTQTSSVSEGGALTTVEDKLLQAFRQASNSNAGGKSNLELTTLAKELRKYEAAINKKKKSAAAGPA